MWSGSARRDHRGSRLGARSFYCVAFRGHRPLNQAGSRGDVTLCGPLGNDLPPPRYDKEEVAMSLRNWTLIVVSTLVLPFLLSKAALGQNADKAAATALVLFRNVRISDGQSGVVTGPSDVLVRGNRIERIAANQSPEPGATLIEGNGRTLMPGLIDMHWHTMLARPSVPVAMSADENYLALLAGVEAERTLMRGFTTVRDVGGPSFGLKRAIDERLVSGPRIFPSGAMISVTSGHGDFRSEHDLPRTLGEPGSRFDRMGYSAIADSPDEVRLRTREQLMRGASQIKLTAGAASPRRTALWMRSHSARRRCAPRWRPQGTGALT
jgi:hypothetical protein